uniref:Bloom syndrome protein-like protein n=1 Tax=Aegilops tauschii TaxID=37682 RepID=N1QP86_AEGTA
MDANSVGTDVSADHVIAELLEMGFEFDKISEAIGVVGPCRADVVEFVLNGSGSVQRKPGGGSQRRSSDRSARLANPRGKFKQSSITYHIASTTGSKTESCGEEPSTSYSCLAANMNPALTAAICLKPKPEHQTLLDDSRGEFDWADKISAVLQKHFGFSCVKGFQKEALDAWFAHKDCLVLAATGSGKSLCFQIPALLTTKVVVVISPLISLMHDQCLKLAKHGISACFLGSGQPDNRVEGKAMAGMYKIIYVCPETVLRLMEPLKKLAEKPGIALFAIDEVHCVSKWGHDFRPDYRKLSVLRQNFCSSKLKFLEHDIPLMALTATATLPVKHSKTSASSYGKDFQELIGTYNASRNFRGKSQKILHEVEPESESSSYESLDDSASDDEDAISDKTKLAKSFVKENAEHELDQYPGVDDFDVSCGEFLESSRPESFAFPVQSAETSSSESLDQGPTIVYVPTRKGTVELANYLCKSGLKAAAYNAKLSDNSFQMPRSHLRQVHEQFHSNALEILGLITDIRCTFSNVLM